jgi:hypothetical protein
MAILRIGAIGTVEISEAGAAVNSSHYGTPCGVLVCAAARRQQCQSIIRLLPPSTTPGLR